MRWTVIRSSKPSRRERFVPGRTSACTESPRATSARTRLAPMKPPAPATRTAPIVELSEGAVSEDKTGEYKHSPAAIRGAERSGLVYLARRVRESGRDHVRTVLPDRFELLLFSTDREFVREAAAAGIDGIIVDWEVAGKERRQAGADTEINHDTVRDLERVRSWVDIPILCRINSPGPETKRELERAIGAGADEVLVPMVRSPHELEAVIDAARGRCGVGVLIETEEAVERVREFARLPISRLYVGLNDLAIDRRSSSIFSALVDDTVQRVSSVVEGSFGFGGLTAPERGHPIPCRLLIGELVRLGSSFSFLRRSYKRDVGGEEQAQLIARLRLALMEAGARTPVEVERDRAELEEAVAVWPGRAQPQAGTLV